MIPNDFPYFHNDEIERRLSTEAINQVVSFMINSGCAEWDDSEHTRLIIMWRRPEVLAGDIYDWAVKNQCIGGVFTVFELYAGEDHRDTSFYGTDPAVFRKALDSLERAGKCVIFQGSTSSEDGVKFLEPTPTSK